MGILGDLGVEGGASTFTGGISGRGLLFWGGIIFLAFVILIVAGVIAFFYYSSKSKKRAFKNQVPIFTTLKGQHCRIGLDWAKEIYVPDSNISLFYLKKHKIYLARPTRAMGENEYWYSISENGEWVNFDMSVNPEDNTLALANYDHRDTRYAYVNLKEIIKKNYKDKTLVWWKDPVIMNIISFVIMSMIFIGFVWFVTARMGKLIDTQSAWIDKMGIISEKLGGAVQNAQNINSGVVAT